jgi:hypothetical protein
VVFASDKVDAAWTLHAAHGRTERCPNCQESAEHSGGSARRVSGRPQTRRCLTVAVQPERWGMLPLAGELPPNSTDQFAHALREGLSNHGVAGTVRAEGDWPKLRSLRVDLSRSRGSRPLPKLNAEEALMIGSVVISGHPVEIEGVPAELDVEFTDLRAGMASSEGAGWQVIPLGAASGNVSLELQRDRLESALQQTIAQLAGSTESQSNRRAWNSLRRLRAQSHSPSFVRRRCSSPARR